MLKMSDGEQLSSIGESVLLHDTRYVGSDAINKANKKTCGDETPSYIQLYVDRKLGSSVGENSKVPGSDVGTLIAKL